MLKGKKKGSYVKFLLFGCLSAISKFLKQCEGQQLSVTPLLKYWVVNYSVQKCTEVQCSAVLCSVLQCIEVPCSALKCNAVQCCAVKCSAVQQPTHKGYPPIPNVLSTGEVLPLSWTNIRMYWFLKITNIFISLQIQE